VGRILLDRELGHENSEGPSYLVRVHRDTPWKPVFLNGTVLCNTTYLPTLGSSVANAPLMEKAVHIQL
jgi:hypothetical protein